jgi:hypothetical protein
MKEFIFKQDNKAHWQGIHDNSSNTLTDFVQHCGHDFVVKIEKYSSKGSDKQLRSYWMLINIVRGYMNDQGNNYSQEEVSDYFKINSSHYRVIGSNKIPRSIKKSSKTTVEEMKGLITTILEFGKDHCIKNCHIEDQALKELLTYYR